MCGVKVSLGNTTQTVFTSTLHHKGEIYRKDTNAYAVNTNYLFKSINLSAGARYTTVNDNDEEKIFIYTDIYTS